MVKESTTFNPLAVPASLHHACYESSVPHGTSPSTYMCPCAESVTVEWGTYPQRANRTSMLTHDPGGQSMEVLGSGFLLGFGFLAIKHNLWFGCSTVLDGMERAMCARRSNPCATCDGHMPEQGRLCHDFMEYNSCGPYCRGAAGQGTGSTGRPMDDTCVFVRLCMVVFMPSSQSDLWMM